MDQKGFGWFWTFFLPFLFLLRLFMSNLRSSTAGIIRHLGPRLSYHAAQQQSGVVHRRSAHQHQKIPAALHMTSLVTAGAEMCHCHP